jgi:hypothetical protein
VSKLFALVSRLLTLYVGDPPSSPAGTANTADRNGALRTAGIIFVLAGSAASAAYLSANSAVLGIGVAGVTVLGYAAEYLRRKWKDYQAGLPTLEETDPSLPLNVFDEPTV